MVSGVSSCCGPIDLTPLKSAACEAATTVKNGFHKTVRVLNTATSTIEARQYDHLILEGAFKIVEVTKGALSQAAQIFSQVMANVEGIFAVWSFVELGKYFFYKVPEKSSEPKIRKDAAGNLYVKQKNYGTTQFEHHLEKKKYLSIAAKVGMFVKGIGAVFTFFDKVQIFNLSAWSAKLSTLGSIGNVVSKIVSPIFFSTLLGVGGVIAFGALTIESIVYIGKAIHDPEKSLVKGLLNLAARAATLALFALMLAGISNPYVLIPVLLVGGVFGLAGMFHSIHRSAHKAEVQQQNMKELELKAGKP